MKEHPEFENIWYETRMFNGSYVFIDESFVINHFGSILKLWVKENAEAS